jgi:hypothetical protein
MKEELEKITGFQLPQPFVDVIQSFTNHFGGQEEGIDKFCDYINCGGSIVSVGEARDYETTPIEFFPFLNTGGDGLHYGYLILAPELNLSDYPLFRFSPGGEGFVYYGNSTRESIENIISSYYEYTQFSEVDIPFLNSIEIFPDASKKDNSIFACYSPEVNPIPIPAPENWIYQMTHDGVGVLAPSELFDIGISPVSQMHSIETLPWNFESDVDDFIKAAKINLKKGFYATALFHLKEAWHFKNPGSEIKELLIKTYRLLKKDLHAETLEKYFEWV